MDFCGSAAEFRIFEQWRRPAAQTRLPKEGFRKAAEFVVQKIVGKRRMVDPASVTPSLKQIKIEKMTNQDLSPSKLVSNPSVEDMMDSDHMTQELDSLKDILSGSGQITLDTSFMTSLMSGDSTEFLNGM